MSTQWKWVIGIVSIIVVFALLACVIFLGWRYFFPGKPSVVIIAPPSNYQVLEGDGVTVEARATGRSIVRLELWVDDGLMETASSPSPQDTFSAALMWQASGIGRHTVEVRAYDAKGQASEPAAIILVVATGVAEVSPTVTLGPAFETPSPTTSPTATPTSPPGATATSTPIPPTPAPTATSTPVPPTVTPTPTPGPPVIESFTADPVTITAGESTTLSWGLVSNATGVVIDQGIGGVGTPGSTVVSPGSTTTYTMTAIGLGGTDTASVTVTVNPPAPTTVNINVDAGNSGRIDDGAVMGAYPNPGDTTTNKRITAFMSWSLSAIPAGATINSASLDLNKYDCWEADGIGSCTGGLNAIADLGNLYVSFTNYGTFDVGDWSAGHIPIQILGSPPAAPIDVTSQAATAVSEGRPWFQIQVLFYKISDGDGKSEGMRFNEGPGWNRLTITYTE